ncbi:RNA polymerase sigma factor [Streptomyces fenghuangensis]|uniref:RNA polymerase sigma factor n=1 Tax=Streptomyces chitinivorans TaxID=1257027 RepID=A0ABW7HYQ3_9ACTN|nr:MULTISPECIES: sigma-70 family RNA polymerase sigma factor [Streptomyces]MCG3043390.1 sigma-70 family RNA polymerase sigma factor [Streptomyces sp. ICN903]MDH2410285.1 sigma-70 family RNA polymerase sigma factor [Streptomyces chitinivorans]
MPNETPDWATGTTRPHQDHAIRRRLVRGEQSALAELYDGHASVVRGLAHRFLDDEDAADRVVAEVFAEIWADPGAYEPESGSLRSWLTELTRRRALRHLEESSLDPRARARLEERIRAASAAARADHMVTAMPGSLRTVLELAYVGRRDYREAAAELGVSEDETRRRLRLGLQLLSAAAGNGAEKAS